MEEFFKKAFTIFIMIMNLLAFIAGIVFTLEGIDGFWLGIVPIISYLFFMITFIGD